MLSRKLRLEIYKKMLELVQVEIIGMVHVKVYREVLSVLPAITFEIITTNRRRFEIITTDRWQ